VNASGNPPPIIDTHAHLDEPAFDADRHHVLDFARAVGVRRFVNIGYKPERWESSRSLRQSHPDVDIERIADWIADLLIPGLRRFT